MVKRSIRKSGKVESEHPKASESKISEGKPCKAFDHLRALFLEDFLRLAGGTFSHPTSFPTPARCLAADLDFPAVHGLAPPLVPRPRWVVRRSGIFSRPWAGFRAPPTLPSLPTSPPVAGPLPWAHGLGPGSRARFLGTNASPGLTALPWSRSQSPWTCMARGVLLPGRGARVRGCRLGLGLRSVPHPHPTPFYSCAHTALLGTD